jgi:putative MATE family efflux protein
MNDLTKGSIAAHILTMAVPIFTGIIMIMICQLVDVYFVSGLGDAAIAGVSAAGNAGFLVNALIQVLSVAAVALVSQAVGRKDQADANLVFNQSLSMAVIWGVVTLIVGSILARSYLRSVASDDATIEAGTTYLLWFLPALALQFVLLVMASALRGTGIVRPTMVIQTLAVIINIVFAPILISGWGTGLALGVAGAGLASSVGVLFGVIMLWLYFHSSERYVAINLKQWRPQLAQWKRILNIGLPAGAEFAIMFFYMAAIYYALSEFGTAAQAGFGIGSRVLGVLQVPAMAVAFAAGPIAGQNFGARNSTRVRETFKTVSLIATVTMIVMTVFAQWRPELLLGAFTKDPETVAIGSVFLQMISLNLVAQGLIFVCSSMFQGIGDTRPVLLSSGARLITYAVPIIWLSGKPGFRIEHVWYLSIVTTTLQAVLCVWLLRRAFLRRLVPDRNSSVPLIA